MTANGDNSTSKTVPATPAKKLAETDAPSSLPHMDESTSTEDLTALTSRIGFEPREIPGLPDPSLRTNEAIVWLDIDNTLYKRSTKIAELMADRIRAYFYGMGLSQEEAKTLHTTYYKTYGLAIRGLVKHHQIDPLDYDRKCDASLPLEDILQPDHQIKRLLTDIDRTRVRVFALTNAYKYHADRVLRLLDLEDQVEGIVYCDYAVPDFACKPELDYYRAALLVVGATKPRHATTLSTIARSTSSLPKSLAGILASTFAKRTTLYHRHRQQAKTIRSRLLHSTSRPYSQK